MYFQKIFSVFIFFFAFIFFSYGQYQFYGGVSDGHSEAAHINQVCSAISVNPYAGGIADGFSKTAHLNQVCSAIAVNPYAGGIADGFSETAHLNQVCSAIAVNPYAGGIADGFSKTAHLNQVCPAIAVNPYSGGIADGFSKTAHLNQVCSAIAVNPYSGGIADGFSSVYKINNSSCDPSPLPIELLFFDAQPNGKVVDVKWITASELNTSYYIVHRSKDGVNYEEVAHVPAAGNSSSVKNYLAIDKEPFMGTSYYNLQQTDMNGQYKYYGPVAVQFTQRDGIFIYPNPASGKFTIQLVNGQSLVANNEIEIYNVLGEKVYLSVINHQSSIIDLNVPNGIYFLHVQTENGTVTKKIVIQK